MPTLLLGQQRVYFRQQGKGRPALLLLHGAGGSSLHFRALLGALGRRARVVAVDLPGHGRSPAPERPLLPPQTLESYRDLTAELAERLGLGKFVLLGHSMGGAVALHFALAYPERLEQLWLVASAARLRVSQEILRILRTDFAKLPELLAGLGHSPAADRGNVAAWAAGLVQAPREVSLLDFRACDGFDVRAQLPSLRVRTVVLGGADDRLTPPELQQELAARIPAARLELITRAGHYLIWERPDAVAASLLRTYPG